MLVELNYPTPIPVELDPAQTLLLIVDMENESAHPKAPLYMGEPVERIIPRIAALRKYVRESGGKLCTRNPCASRRRWNLLFSRMSFVK